MKPAGRVILPLLLLPILCMGQNTRLLETQYGYRDFKFGMTSEEVNALGIFSIPPKSRQLVATEYNHSDVTYVAYHNLDQFKGMVDNGYAFYMDKPLKYICLLFYQNRLFKVRLHFFDQYHDDDARILENANRYYGVATANRKGDKHGQLTSQSVKYEGVSEANGTETTIMFERLHVDGLIASGLPYDDRQMPNNDRQTDFYGRVVDKAALCQQASGFMSEQDVERLISEILAMQGLQNRFIVVGCSSVTNCIASVDKDKRPVILFNPSFLQQVQKLHFSESRLPAVGEKDWTTLTILAHEIGHHLNNHIINPLPNATSHDKELEADRTAGFLLYLMGGRLEQGMPAFRESSETGTYSHPPRAQRHEALTRGYRDAEKRFPRSR